MYTKQKYWIEQNSMNFWSLRSIIFTKLILLLNIIKQNDIKLTLTKRYFLFTEKCSLTLYLARGSGMMWLSHGAVRRPPRPLLWNIGKVMKTLLSVVKSFQQSLSVLSAVKQWSTNTTGLHYIVRPALPRPHCILIQPMIACITPEGDSQFRSG